MSVLAGISLPYAAIYSLGVFLAACSQVLLKKSALRSYPRPILEYLNPWVIAAYAIFFGTTLLSAIGYRGIPPSFGPILETASYLYVTAFGVLIFRERLSGKKLAALALIVLGIALYALGAMEAAGPIAP